MNKKRLHAIVAGALYDLMGQLTTRKTPVILSSTHEATYAVEALVDFANLRGLDLDDADVKYWQIALDPSMYEQPAGTITTPHPFADFYVYRLRPVSGEVEQIGGVFEGDMAAAWHRATEEASRDSDDRRPVYIVGVDDRGVTFLRHLQA